MDEHNGMEQRLRAMRPAKPDPALRERIAESLAEEGPGPLSAWSLSHRYLVGLAAVAAVCFLVWGVSILLSKPDSEIPMAEQNTPDDSTFDLVFVRPVLQDNELPTPTLLALNDAYRQSPQQVDVLLDRIGKQQLARLSKDPAPTAGIGLSADFYKESP